MGIDDLLNVIVSLENSEENSYNTHVLLTYPAGFSYRKVTVLQVKQEHRVWINSHRPENSNIKCIHF